MYDQTNPGTQQDAIETSESLAAFEEEHGRLSERRKRLHEAIDVMERAGSLKPDAAALLARYKQTERTLSWERGVLYRKIQAARAGGATEQPLPGGPAEDLRRRVHEGLVDVPPAPVATAETSAFGVGS